ncbi:hypothetical protein [Candidatus Nitrosocosmicus sp. FF01]|jgi:hypothetical protein|uniref:hypothetical protein n=1 Tax=Candidatus Nitrosocosmicus sp. FF01 TaxID=3397670 RepID=UPI0039E75133
MLVKIESIDKPGLKVKATLLDIDELGSVVPVKALSLNILPGDDSIVDLLKASSHAIIFTEASSNEDHPTVISAINLTDDELNDEKEKMIRAATAADTAANHLNKEN